MYACKECGHSIDLIKDKIEGTKLFECPSCGHPHDIDELEPTEDLASRADQQDEMNRLQ
jgi:uncharacterized Zn finger protein